MQHGEERIIARRTGLVMLARTEALVARPNRTELIAAQWVPYPVDIAQLRDIVPDQWSQVTVLAEQPSAYGGTMYLAAISRMV